MKHSPRFLAQLPPHYVSIPYPLRRLSAAVLFSVVATAPQELQILDALQRNLQQYRQAAALNQSRSSLPSAAETLWSVARRMSDLLGSLERSWFADEFALQYRKSGLHPKHAVNLFTLWFHLVAVEHDLHDTAALCGPAYSDCMGRHMVAAELVGAAQEDCAALAAHLVDAIRDYDASM